MITLFRCYRYRLYPTTEQKIMFAKTFGCVRFIYNKMLSERIDYYKQNGKMLYKTPKQYKEEYPWLKEVDSLALNYAQMHLNQAYKNFWSNSDVFGKPQFKTKRTHHYSYSTYNQRGTVRIAGNKVKLPKVGWVKLSFHRPLMQNSAIKTVTICKTATGKYFISILAEYENQILPVVPKRFLGLDFAMHGLYVASDEENADYPNYFRKAERKLARAARIMSRRKRGSSNWEKQRLRYATICEKVANQRSDFLHKKAYYLAEHYDAIGIEDIDIKAIAHHKKGSKFRLGKSANDNSWATFVRILQYKLEWQGKVLIKIDKWYPSSQTCHVCNYKNKEVKDLYVRDWYCPQCGTHHDRDKNAAINIREEARRIIA